MYEIPVVYRERALWAGAGIALLILLFLFSGGLYTITPPNGPVDSAYVMNRITGKVWLVKTFTKQVGQVRVLSARVAEVEKTRDISADDTSAVAMADDSSSSHATRRR